MHFRHEVNSMFTVSFILYLIISLNSRILLSDVFNPNLVNNPLASYSLITLGFLLSQTTQFDKCISFPFFVFESLGF